ncbi:uncharacterized protein LOC133192851 [Saccostrea echinata]|uniref:uncharacterized protein LOC133192851 n=1 Tax=Saccostrea echinata TaxID=191078 RepID=UPI002A83400E|nr:uncharacterized protein LOC133192851 [Saccostrea echinata]
MACRDEYKGLGGGLNKQVGNRIFLELENERDSSEGLSVSFDGGWQKRGSGRSYSSLSGHATFIGNKSGKCIAFSTRNKFCRTYEVGKRRECDSAKHDCRQNWKGSSKAMESDMCVNMLRELDKQDVSIDTIIMDNDSTTIARARSEVKPDLKKMCDKNHTLKEFTNQLYDLKKVKNFRELTAKTIGHLSKCFKYCVSQHQGNGEKMKKNLLAIGKHVFGDHSFCDSWCGYLRSPLTYKPKNLPCNRYLTDVNFKTSIMTLLQKYIDKAEKLSSLGSSQANESLNNTISSKAPKAHFYSGSESNDFRIAAAVAQKNIGYGYVSEVCESVLLSPGEVTKKISQENDRKRDMGNEREKTLKYKRNRRIKKEERSTKQKTCELREGETYNTAVDLNNNNHDIIEIPHPLTEPTCQKLTSADYSYVSFDLETTGLGKDCDITQIGAAFEGQIFSQYILPSKPISPAAFAVTGLAVSGGSMYKEGYHVPSTSTEEGIQNFLDWLSKIPQPVLMAHNARFDACIFCRILLATEKSIPASKLICGFVDTLPLFRKQLPERTSYKQVDLVKDLLHEDYSAHDAASDSRALLHLVKAQKFNNHILQENSFSFQSYMEVIQFQNTVQDNTNSLSYLLENKIISKVIANKISKSGLGLAHLQLAYDRDRDCGIHQVLSETTSTGKPRVTVNKTIIKNICQYFHDKHVSYSNE